MDRVADPPQAPGRRQVRVARAGASNGRLIAGSRGYQHEPLEPGWDLEEIGGADPPDLAKRFAQLSTLRQNPRGPS